MKRGWRKWPAEALARRSATVRAAKTLQQRFDEKYIPEPNSGCWLWIGAVDRKGYGQLRYGGRNRVATHISLFLVNRVLPLGMFALHRCDVSGCVNPDHLFHGTAKENTNDMYRKGRASPPPGSLALARVLAARAA